MEPTPNNGTYNVPKFTSISNVPCFPKQRHGVDGFLCLLIHLNALSTLGLSLWPLFFTDHKLYRAILILCDQKSSVEDLEVVSEDSSSIPPLVLIGKARALSLLHLLNGLPTIPGREALLASTAISAHTAYLWCLWCPIGSRTLEVTPTVCFTVSSHF